MITRQKWTAILAVLLLLNTIPVLAVETEALPEHQPVTEVRDGDDAGDEEAVLLPPNTEECPPVLQMELINDGDAPGLYGTLSHLPADTVEILVLYSFDRNRYDTVETTEEGGVRRWDLTGLTEGTAALTQLCMSENDSPLRLYLGQTEHTLYTKLQIMRQVGESIVQTDTEVVSFTCEQTGQAPTVPPEFTARIETSGQGDVLVGHFSDWLTGTAKVTPMYSLDGETYEVICPEQPYDWNLDMLGTQDEQEQIKLYNQTCAHATVEPLKSYLAGRINSFYIKLQITLQDGVCYDTSPFRLVRGAAQPLPEDATIYAIFPATMRVSGRPSYGQYQVTVPENVDGQGVYALLPDTVPVEIQITLPDTPYDPLVGYVETAVVWNTLPELSLTAGEPFTIVNAANSIIIPAGTQVQTSRGIYILPEKPVLNDEIRVVLNPVAENAKAEGSLRGSLAGNETENQLPLTLAFALKPSGATEIMAYSFEEGDADWTQLGDLLERRAVDTNQSKPLYGYVDLLQPEDTPYQRYLQGEISGFLIGLTIKGGVYDGETVTLPWPGEYDPPPRVPEIGGSGGNENNAGNGNGDGGQRPNPPDKNEPPLIVPPPSEPELPTEPEPIPGLIPTPEPEPAKGTKPTWVTPPASIPTQNPAPIPKPPLLPTPALTPEPDAPPSHTETAPEETAKPTWSPSESAQIPSARTVDPSRPDQAEFPPAVTLGLLAAGAAAAVGIALTTTGATASSGAAGRLLSKLKKWLSTK